MLKRARLSFANTVHFGGKHAWYRARACVHLEMYMQIVFSCCTYFFFLILLSPVTISKVIAGICIFNMIKKPISVYCFIKKKKKSTIANTEKCVKLCSYFAFLYFTNCHHSKRFKSR